MASSVSGAARRLLLPAAAVVPPTILYGSFRKRESREISLDEVRRSRRALSFLRRTVDDDEDVRFHSRNLRRHGATVLQNLLSPDEVDAWNKHLDEAVFETLETEPPGETVDAMTTTTTTTSTKVVRDDVRRERGRWHSHQDSKRAPYNALFRELVSSRPRLRSVVRSYFAEHDVTRYRLTQLQFLLARDGSMHQIWHRDNVAPGLTLLISLKDVRGNGPTELFLRSHHRRSESFGLDDDDENARNDGGEELFTSNDGDVVLACLVAGDAVLYDARVLHRGRGFVGGDGDDEQKEDRPVLILRWDALSTPPPGASFILTNLNDWSGTFKTVAVAGEELLKQISSWKK